MARVWLDAQTGKQARLAVSIGRVLSRAGHEVLVTVRDYDFAAGIVKASGLQHKIVGIYGGGSLREKLEADISRMRDLTRVAAEFKPDILISYPIPSAVRVAYGLGVKIIVMSDSPHSVPVHELTVPLADILLHSALIPTWFFARYKPRRVEVFYGVEELEWVKGYECSRATLDKLGLQPGEYIVLRTSEWKAVYYRGRRVAAPEALIDAALKRGYSKVVVFPRYPEDYEHLLKLKEKYGEHLVIVWREPVETLDLYCHAAGVVTGGATMAREAALMCTPSVSLYPVYVNIALEKLGFPIRSLEWRGDPTRVYEILERLSKKGKCPAHLLEAMEKPSDILVHLVGELV